MIWRSLSASASLTRPAAGIGGAVEFRTDVFDAASIEVLVKRLERVLTAMTVNPAARLSSVDLLDEGEQATLTGGATARCCPPGARPGVDPGAVGRAGRADSHRGRGGVR